MRVSLSSLYLLLIVGLLQNDLNDGAGLDFLDRNIRFACHCVGDQCLKDGTCRSGVPCKKGYFGFTCQYVDGTYNVSQSHPELTDYNDETCIQGTTVKKVTIRTAKLGLTYLRIVFNETYRFFELSINKGHNPCRWYTVMVSLKVVDYYCLTPEPAQDSLVIEGPGVENLCSVYVSRGRNVAMRAKMEQSSTDERFIDSRGATDGDRSYSVFSCQVTHVDDQRPSMKMKLGKEVYIYWVYILTVPGSEGEFQGVSLQAKDRQGGVLTKTTFPAEGAVDYEFDLNLYDQKAASLSLLSETFRSSNSSKNMGLCEIEVYGDCAHGEYGLDCSKNCSARCGNQQCTIEGYCYYCAENNMSGLYCETTCSKNCAGDGKCAPNGTCTDGCVKTFYGADCTQKCSPFCDEDGSCDVMTGKCTHGCFIGYNRTVVPESKDDTSAGGNQTYGPLIVRIQDPNCTMQCPHGKYGVNCSNDCSTHCGNEMCTKEGHCFHCADSQMSGLYCNQSCMDTCSGDQECICANGCILSNNKTQCNRTIWTGPNNKILCHCSGGRCMMDGTCEPNVPCKGGYFGFACQYVDGTYGISQLYPELTDYKDKTCIQVNNFTNVTIRTARTRLRYIRLVFNDTYRFTRLIINKGKGACRWYRVMVSSTVVDYYCPTPDPVQDSLVIEGPGAENLCSVYISRGRNVALKAEVRQSTRDERFLNSRGATDGNRTYSLTSCQVTRVEDQMPHISVKLDMEVYIYWLYILNVPGGEREFPGVELLTLRRSGIVLMWIRIPLRVQMVYEFDHTLSKDITAYSVLMKAGVHKFKKLKQNIGVCEIEVYGDCPHGQYGLDCSKSCPARCGNQLCSIEGYCYYCADPFASGRYCNKTCSKNCAGDQKCTPNGTCTDGCVQAYHGADCTQKCHPFCGVDGSCDGVTGECPYGCRLNYNSSGPPESENNLSAGGFSKFGLFMARVQDANCSKVGLPDEQTGPPSWNCHCEGSDCSATSERCTKSHKCMKGWFGFSCQYRDLALEAKVIHPLLTDNDEDSCINATNNTISAEWGTSRMLSWVWITFQPHAEIRKLQMTYLSGELVRPCRRLSTRLIYPKRHILQVSCRETYFKRKLILSWKGSGMVCTLSVNGGQNVAVFSEITSRSVPKLQLQQLIDGEVGSGNCLQLTHLQIVKFTYKKIAVALTSILIYTDALSKTNGDLTVDCVNKNRISVYKANISVREPRLITLEVKTQRGISDITLAMKGGTVRLCEVEIFGDCYQPNYGFGCKDMCLMTCNQDRCAYDSICYECRPGRFGPHCLTTNYMPTTYHDELYDVMTTVSGEVSLEFKHEEQKSHFEKYWLLVTLSLAAIVIVIALASFILRAVFSTTYASESSSSLEVDIPRDAE